MPYSKPAYGSADGHPTFSVSVNPEEWRVRFYFFFWTLCAFAVIITQIWVKPFIEAGAPPDTPTERLGCGPFNREGWEGLEYGMGFDFEHTHLIQAFGFGNICTNWDYPPARQIIAMYFPLFEYSFVVYLILDYACMRLAYIRGEIPGWYFSVVKTVTPFCILLVILFRMIFVIVAYEDVRGHTAGFLGLQVALLVVTIMNCAYVYLTGQDYPDYGISASTAATIALTYGVVDFFVTCVKIYGTAFIVTGNGSPPAYFFYDTPFGTLGSVIDKFYMLTNAVLPPIIAYVRMTEEESIEIKVDGPVHVHRESDVTSETSGLIN